MRLNTPKKYKGKPFDIPFAVAQNGVTLYKVKLSVSANLGHQAFIETAVDRYITHYFPEFYPALDEGTSHLVALNQEYSRNPASLASAYDSLRSQLIDKTQIETQYPTSPPSAKEIVICTLNHSVFEEREILVEAAELPSFAASLAYFNQTCALQPTEAQTEFPVMKLSPIMQSLQDTFGKFGKELARTPGPQIPVPIEFGFLGISLSKVLSAFTEDLTAVVKGTSRSYKFREGDTLTFYFGRIQEDTTGKLFVIPKYGITDIRYLATDKSISVEHLKIGHFSMVKYSQALKDPVTVATLKNYNSLLETARQKDQSGGIFSIEEFFGSAVGMDTSQGFSQAWNNSPNPDTAQDDENNALINRAVELGIIDIADTAALQVSIGAYTSEQLIALNNAVTTNPELYEAVFAGEEKKMEEVSPDVFGEIQKALLEGPMAAIDDNSPVGAFMRHFGIKALVKEALLCLTFGLNFEIARIVAIIEEIKGIAENGNIVVEFGGSVKGVTKPQIQIPSIGDLSEMFPMFLITGDIWKMILDIVIESLQEALIQIIAQLTELLRELCDFNNPRTRDYGDTNMRDLVPSPRNPDMGSEGGPLDPFQGTNLEDTGMGPNDILDYLDDLSNILSSVDICILLTNPAGAGDELLQKILDFNLTYEPNAIVSSTLITFSDIIGFFAQLAKVVDVTDLCNEIANEVGTINQDNICLTDDDIQSVNLDDMDNIETLLDILQKGLRPDDVFTPNFDCPDNPNYIEDPTFKKSIYETLNALVEIVELQFSYSSESIKNVMLDTRLQAASGASANALSSALGANGRNLNPETPNIATAPSWPPPPDEIMIGILKSILEGFEDFSSYSDRLQACINDNQDLLELNITLDENTIGPILDSVKQGLEIGFAAVGGLGNLIDALDDAQTAANSGSPLVSRKVFNQRFLKEFRDYIQLSAIGSETPDALIDEVNTGTSASNIFKVPAGSTINTLTYNLRGRFGEGFASGREELIWYFRTVTARPGLVSGSALERYQATAASRFGTSDDGEIKFVYPGYQKNQAGNYGFQLDALFEQTPGAEDAFDEELSSIDTLQITLDPIVDSVRNTLLGSANPPDAPEVTSYAEKRVVPLANGLLTDYLFDYYINNGIFDAATLQSLSFFHDNENCSPGDTADLLDVDGIIDEMLNMFQKISCYSDLPARKKVRLALKYGMYLLFVQIHIAEFVIKNIFVFSAAELDELFGKNFILLYMRKQIENSMSQYLDTLDEASSKVFVNDLIEIFQIINKMEGGLTDLQGNLLFPEAGPNALTSRGTYNKIINYLVGQRITNSRSSVNNAIKQSHPNANPLPLEEIFLRSIPTYTTHKDDWINPNKTQFFANRDFAAGAGLDVLEQDFGPVGSRMMGYPDETIGPYPRLFLVKEYHPRNDLNPPSTPGNNDPVENNGSIDYILRYQFWLSFPDTLTPDLGPNLRVYPLLPAGRNSYPVAATLQALAYLAQDRTFDRIISLAEDDPVRDGQVPAAANPNPDPGQNPLNWNSAELTADDVEFLLALPEYQEYFTNVFNKDLLSMIPLIQNFYLTTKYFDEIGASMKSTKDACLSIIMEAIATNDRYDSTPNMSRDSSSAFNNTLPEGNPFEAMMRDFIILMLIKTPIDILKGILELVDPHVAISKIIKNITGKLFNVLSQVFDDIIEQAEPLQALGIDSGEKLLAIVLCFMDVLMKNPPNGAPFPEGLQAEMEAFFPRITQEGVDFLGSIMGLFMIPPTPLGILYLLLSLINVEIPSFGVDTGDSALVDASTSSTPPTEC